MFRRVLIAVLALSIVPVTGCVKPNTTPTPQTLAPGYTSPADQAMGQTLVGAHNFYQTVQCSTLGQGIIQSTGNCDPNTPVTKYTPSSTEKTALNNFAAALNAAQVVYNSYHSGQATQAQAQAAVNAVTAQQSVLQNSITGGK